MDVTMPQFGETVAEATVTRWLKSEGDPVTEGEPLLEISTDKVDMEIPSTVTGVLGAISVQEDQTVAVGTVLAVIDTALATGPRDPQVVDGQQLTPLVRRLLKEHGLEATDVKGTGPQGRITRQDVLDAAATRQEPSAEPETKPQDGESIAVPFTTAPFTTVPFTTVRRLTAEHMVRSKAVSPHTLMAMEIDYSGVDRVRGSVAESWRAAEGSNLTYLPFVARAVVDAIARYPHVNASVGQDGLIVYRRVHLGIAVDLDGDGLVVPVVRDADGKRLGDLAREVARLASAARTRTAGPQEFAGGTFTISNPGPFGTLLTGAIINQPQVAILATDAVKPRPVAVPVGNGQYGVAVRPVGNLALTFDHRAIDGGYAARFLAAVKEILENRDWITEL